MSSGGALKHDDGVQRLEVLNSDDIHSFIRVSIHHGPLSEQLLSKKAVQRP